MHELDADSLDGVNGAKNMKLAKVEKHTHKYRRSLRKHNHYQCQHKDAGSPCIKDSLKQKIKRDKNLSREKFPQVENIHKRKSIITKNRLTISIGIYNKGKKSETIYREQRKSRFFNKVSNGLKEKTSKDISKVLDCSSFQIKPFLVAAEDNPVYDFNNPGFSSSYAKLTNQIGSCSPEKNEIHLFEASPISRNQVTNKDLSSVTLPIETPLEDIKQNIMNKMRPLEIFKRDYLQEIVGELNEYYHKSSTLNLCEEHHSTATNTSPILLGSTSKIESNRGKISSIGKIERMEKQHVHTGIHESKINEDDKTRMETEVKKKNNKQLDTFSESSPTTLESVSRCIGSDERICADNMRCGNIDILSMLMGEDLRCTDDVDRIGIVPPVYSNISPLKKPSLEIESPPEKLFPRKLF